ncbi:MAG TPA: DUF6622 family protein [Azospirillum sp.]|nr:DUF6622 family protein [Azospirillum sp.]
MSTVTQILLHTPPWVFGLFAALLWLGLRRLSPSDMKPARLLIVPAVFLAWGVAGMATKPLPAETILLGWLAGLAAGLAVGMLNAPVAALRVDRAAGRIRVPGSAAPLLIGMGVFFTKYALAVATAMRPDWREFTALAELAVSGGSAGYFVGFLLRTALAYPGLPDAAPSHP